MKPTCPLAGWPPPKTSETRGPTTTDVSSARKTCFWVESEAKTYLKELGVMNTFSKQKGEVRHFQRHVKDM